MLDAFQKLLLKLPPESAHTVALNLLRAIGPILPLKRSLAPITLMGLELPNPVGLAAGLDKNGICLPAWKALGFGFVEVGTVTPYPQSGNLKPRLFRLPSAQALINRLGFNSEGMEAVYQNLKKRPHDLIVGVNIGKNKDTPLSSAVEDYRAVLQKLYPVADYFVLNISSPNTPGLRELQSQAYRDPLLFQIKILLEKLNQQAGLKKPLLVKIAPDLSEEMVADLSESFIQTEINGVIATNTTLERRGVQGLPGAEEGGGLSGRPLFERSTLILEQFARQLSGQIPLIGVGGILSKADVFVKKEAGASAVQLYTGFIYRGTTLIQEAVSAWC